MTREEALKKIQYETILAKDDKILFQFCSLPKASIVIKKDVEELIDKIFNDFESRTCENCKHFTFMSRANSYICSSLDNQSVKWIDKDFGCNKFERRVE